MEISAIIPAYNAEAWLGRAIDSILAQTPPVHEIIVVDDESKDATAKVAQGYGERVKYVWQKNGGPAAARNAAIKIATGDWLALCDADDWWEPDKLRLQIAEIEASPEVILVYTSLRLVSDAGVRGIRKACPPKLLWPQLRYRNPITPSSVIVRREAIDRIGGFDERRRGSEDWAAWMKLYPLGKFVALDAPLTNYRVAPSSLSSNSELMFNDFSQMVEEVLLAGISGISRRIWRRRIISYQAFSAGLTARDAGAPALERRFLKLSVLHWPSPFFHPTRLKALAVTLRNGTRVE
jgi:glycosyltransferase involved in cell wall biosynthesis